MNTRILHLEDNEDDQVLLREYLEGYSAEFLIQSAASLGEAVASLQEANVDLILADLYLPDGAGTETFKALQRAAPDVPIVLLTGRNDDAFAIELLSLGAQDYLPKEDMTPRTLTRAIRHALERNRGARVLKFLLDDQRQKQQEIRRAEQHFRMVVEMAPNAMVIIEADGRIGLLNSQAEKLFRYDRRELINQPFDSLVPDRFRPGDSALWKSLLKAAPAAPDISRELMCRRKDGTEVPIEVSAKSLNSPDGQFLIASILDLTTRNRELSQLKRTIDEKLALLKEVHHRSKNNLQIISSMLSLQARSLEEPLAAAKLGDVQQRLSAMALIQEQLYQSPDVSSINLAAYIQILVRNLFSAYGVGQSITHRLELDQICVYENQAVPCGLLINELISNALKYAYPAGRGEILVRMERASNTEVCIVVADEGVGMPAGFDIKTSNSLGSVLIGLLAKQLDGSLELDYSAGVSCAVRFPIQPTAQYMSVAN